MNELFFVGLRWGNDTMIGHEAADGSIRRIAPDDLAVMLSNRFVQVKSTDRNGNKISRRESVVSWWMKHQDRRE